MAHTEQLQTKVDNIAKFLVLNFILQQPWTGRPSREF